MEDNEKPSEVKNSYGLGRTSIYPWLGELKEKGGDARVESIAHDLWVERHDPRR